MHLMSVQFYGYIDDDKYFLRDPWIYFLLLD